MKNSLLNVWRITPIAAVFSLLLTPLAASAQTKVNTYPLKTKVKTLPPIDFQSDDSKKGVVLMTPLGPIRLDVGSTPNQAQDQHPTLSDLQNQIKDLIDQIAELKARLSAVEKAK